MRRNIFFLTAALFCSVAVSCRQPAEEGPRVLLTNPGNFAHADAPVVISRDEWSKVPGNIPGGKYLLLKDSSGQPVPCQLDDLDGDGRWDEAALLYSFGPHQQVTLTYEWVDSSALPAFPQRTGLYLGKWDSTAGKYRSVRSEDRPADHHRQLTEPFLYQMEGPGWENDRIAFRTYFDERNGKDIYGKRIPQLYLEKIGAPGAPSYHDLHDWGMDILKVGNSLGAGSLALWYKDSLYRLGQTAHAKAELLVEGPVRSILRLSYSGWKVADSSYSLQETITIWAGVYGYMSETNLQGPLDSVNLVTGIVMLKGNPRLVNTGESTFRAIGSFGAQSEHGDNLGLAVVYPAAELVTRGMAPRAPIGDSIVANTYYVRLKSEPQPIRFYFYAGWALSDERFKDKKGFVEYLNGQMGFLNNPILVTFPERR